MIKDDYEQTLVAGYAMPINVLEVVLSLNYLIRQATMPKPHFGGSESAAKHRLKMKAPYFRHLLVPFRSQGPTPFVITLRQAQRHP
jgi:hypothetical protein